MRSQLRRDLGKVRERDAQSGLRGPRRVHRVQLYGSVEITKDRIGLKRARELKALLDRVVEALEAEELPEAVAIETTDAVDNPFL